MKTDSTSRAAGVSLDLTTSIMPPYVMKLGGKAFIQGYACLFPDESG